MTRKAARIACLALAAGLLLAACGKKAPLRLPPTDEPGAAAQSNL